MGSSVSHKHRVLNDFVVDIVTNDDERGSFDLGNERVLVTLNYIPA